MERRKFIAGLGGVVAAGTLPLALRQGLKESGFVEGRDVSIETRYADNQ